MRGARLEHPTIGYLEIARMVDLGGGIDRSIWSALAGCGHNSLVRSLDQHVEMSRVENKRAGMILAMSCAPESMGRCKCPKLSRTRANVLQERGSRRSTTAGARIWSVQDARTAVRNGPANSSGIQREANCMTDLQTSIDCVTVRSDSQVMTKW